MSYKDTEIVSDEEECCKVEPLNPYEDGTARTIKAQYQQSSVANFIRQDGLGATGVIAKALKVGGANTGGTYPMSEGGYSRSTDSTRSKCGEQDEPEENGYSE